MSGHSKWKTIKHKKKAEDRKRSKLFTRLSREITVAVREGGGGDPEFNFSLRMAIDRAKDANMPKENIERAIKRGTGELSGGELESAMYESYAPHGIGILTQVLTDNTNRAVSDVRRVISRHGGSMAEAGGVSWQFERKGYITLEPDGIDEDQAFEVAVEAGAEDIDFGDDLIEVYAAVDDFQPVQEAFEEAGIKTKASELSMIPKNTLALDEKESFKIMNIIEELEDLDDVQNVYSNLDISDGLLEKYEAKKEE